MNKKIDIRSFYNNSLKESSDTYESKRWLSTSERRAAYKMTLYNVLKYALPYVTDDCRMLEVGAGPGTWTKQFLKKAPKMNVDIADISDEMLGQARENLEDYKNINYIQTDFEEFEPNHTYDFFFSSRAIEYMPNIDIVAKAIGKSLKKGGTGCVITKYPHYVRTKLTRRNTRDVHGLQIKPSKLVTALESAQCEVQIKKPVTLVVPWLRSGVADLLAYNLFGWLPLLIVQPLCESYLVVFTKK